MITKHPAHGPVSLDRLHQIREILSKAAAQSDGGNLGYAMADAVKVIDGAIASFGAEPVLYAAEETLTYAKMGELHLKCLSKPMGDAVIPLYRHAKPVPVVPVEMNSDKAWGGLKISAEDCQAWSEGWNACRSAMLQAGNSPIIGIDLASEPDRSVEVRYLAPPGYVMVPVEPTMEMLDEFDSIIDYGAEDSKDAWGRLIALAPQQEVKSALEHGMQRYAGAMQKLSEGDK
ncbi:hypothetical protein KJB16_002597 [Salmonella enterica]|nr:hypothetical protein [Salmonella enterica]EDT6533246.1 hypothetical protein [Salmonella enterica subsp. enterica]EKQ4547450.1 hypothetical protein [Salmonella enterica subsp. enterica serovar Ruiru]EHN5647541.1 hypothetical protein [Salmonella enterica]EHN5665054.1 hypothetical protein [Salmonella enterica]